MRIQTWQHYGSVKWCPMLFCVLVVGLGDPAPAAIWDPFGGYADISAVQGTVDGIDQNSLRQDYSLAFEQKVSPWVDLRLAYRFFKFDQAFELDPGVFRQEKQPSAELRWTHPHFQVSGSLQSREVETQAQGALITNTSQAVAKTRDTSWPLLELRYDDQHSYFPDQRDQQDIRNQRLQMSATLDRVHHSWGYTFSHGVTDNVVSEQKTTGDRHLFRWRGQGRSDGGRLRLSGNYNFSYVDQMTVNEAGDAVLGQLPILTGLYSQTTAPDLVTLAESPGLADGNTATPVVPEIDLGGANTDHNLGADLGSVRAVGAFYVYTDRSSGTHVRWEIWGSQDNLTWTRAVSNPRQDFNLALSRYELTFGAINYRYVKAVNSGLNEVGRVVVTEVQAFEELSAHPENRLLAAAHQVDGRLDYQFNNKWRGNFDLSYQADENPGRSGDRSQGAAGARVNYLPSSSVSHNLNWQLSNQWYESGNADLRENTASYTLAWTPLETFRGSASISDRLTWLDGQRSQHKTGAAWDGNMDLLHGLTLGFGGGVSRDDNDFSGLNSESWNVRGRIDAAVTAKLDLSLDATHFESLEMTTDEKRVRRVYGLGLDWRLTRTIFARMTLRDMREETHRFTIDGLLSWNLLPSLRISAQHYELGNNDQTTTLRQSVNLNWELTRRANLYLRVAKLDLSGSGGTRTTSFQQGLRINF